MIATHDTFLYNEAFELLMRKANNFTKVHLKLSRQNEFQLKWNLRADLPLLPNLLDSFLRPANVGACATNTNFILCKNAMAIRFYGIQPYSTMLVYPFLMSSLVC